MGNEQVRKSLGRCRDKVLARRRRELLQDDGGLITPHMDIERLMYEYSAGQATRDQIERDFHEAMRASKQDGSEPMETDEQGHEAAKEGAREAVSCVAETLGRRRSQAQRERDTRDEARRRLRARLDPNNLLAELEEPRRNYLGFDLVSDDHSAVLCQSVDHDVFFFRHPETLAVITNDPNYRQKQRDADEAFRAVEDAAIADAVDQGALDPYDGLLDPEEWGRRALNELARKDPKHFIRRALRKKHGLDVLPLPEATFTRRVWRYLQDLRSSRHG